MAKTTQPVEVSTSTAHSRMPASTSTMPGRTGMMMPATPTTSRMATMISVWVTR
ncbi:hypothetical protein [Nocardioides piscis]|uniref:Uncharacterized protein n=1 Tax=Nocardioides piscis TaxID=2714938 RepID=A0A6G7YBN6_9ACTN|nr:hypothetical protein G7071_13685 [Nocardioides piscis]